MCACAIYWWGIPRAVYGTSTETLRNLGWSHRDLSAEEVSRRASPVSFETVDSVLEAERDALFEEAALRMEGGT